jgi:hypothetical protein
MRGTEVINQNKKQSLLSSSPFPVNEKSTNTDDDKCPCSSEEDIIR